MPCPVCGRVYCDHTPEERGQTPEELRAILDADVATGWSVLPQSDKSITGIGMSLSKIFKLDETGAVPQ